MNTGGKFEKLREGLTTPAKKLRVAGVAKFSHL